MKIKALILSLMILTAGCNAFSEEWVLCGRTEEWKMYYDAKSIKTLPNGNKIITYKNTLFPNAKAVEECDCGKDQMRQLSITMDDKYVVLNRKFEPIPNDKTPKDVMFFVACDQRDRFK